MKTVFLRLPLHVLMLLSFPILTTFVWNLSFFCILSRRPPLFFITATLCFSDLILPCIYLYISHLSPQKPPSSRKHWNVTVERYLWVNSCSRKGRFIPEMAIKRGNVLLWYIHRTSLLRLRYNSKKKVKYKIKYISPFNY